MNILNQQETQTMTSQQIADLVDSRHDNVKRTILSLNTAGVIQLPQREEVKNDRGQTVVLYRFSGEQGKRDSIVVVAQLSPEFTAKLVDRWAELEAQASSPVMALPDFTNPVTAARAWADEYQAKQLARDQLAIAAPKAAALDTLSHAKGSLGIRETANTVGIPERKFIARCTDENKPVSSRFMYRDDKNKLRAYAHRIKQGFMTQKITSYAGRNGKDIVTVQVKFTAAGVAHVAKLMQNKPVNELRVLEAV